MTVSTIEFQLRSAEATWNFAKWLTLPDDGNRYEVIDGVLYMSTSPSFEHQIIVWNLAELVGMPLKRQGIAIGVFSPVGVIMEGADPVQPDFLLLRAERKELIRDGRIYGVPDLIAEVLSPSNPSYDLVTKRAAYARAGVPEYWVVRPETGDVLVLSDPDPTQSDYRQEHIIPGDAELRSPTLPITVSVAALFAPAFPS
ncbi:MAG: Uma2 family endonuclease [Chloroflexi bacterium]|nr:MAG: Uma2 family endonuclease [Chloroflexota bacterium]